MSFKYKHKRKWKLCHVMHIDADKDELHLRLPGKEKVEDDVIINVERDMEKLKKLGPEGVEVEEDKARQSQQKTLAAAMRAEGLKERQRNPAGVSLMY